MSRILNPKIWYLVGIGAAALALDGARRLVRKQRQAAESASVVYDPTDEYVPIFRSIPVVEPRAEAKPETEPKVEVKRVVVTARPVEKTTQAVKDDLTGIKGIGPTYAGRLAAAGIVTFAELAAASPNRLREITKATAMANPEEWIAQAAAKK